VPIVNRGDRGRRAPPPGRLPMRSSASLPEEFDDRRRPRGRSTERPLRRATPMARDSGRRGALDARWTQAPASCVRPRCSGFLPPDTSRNRARAATLRRRNRQWFRGAGHDGFDGTRNTNPAASNFDSMLDLSLFDSRVGACRPRSGRRSLAHFELSAARASDARGDVVLVFAAHPRLRTRRRSHRVGVHFDTYASSQRA